MQQPSEIAELRRGLNEVAKQVEPEGRSEHAYVQVGRLPEETEGVDAVISPRR